MYLKAHGVCTFAVIKFVMGTLQMFLILPVFDVNMLIMRETKRQLENNSYKKKKIEFEKICTSQHLYPHLENPQTDMIWANWSQ